MEARTIILLSAIWIFVVAEPSTSHHPYAKGNFFQIVFGVPSSSIKTCKCKCGIPNRRDRFLGGTDLRPYEFPWLAQIHAKGLLPTQGTLINDRHVISSAITLIGFSPYDVKVKLGVYDNCYPDVTSTTMSVSSIIIHPEFQYVTRQNDLAILRLSTIVPYHRRISPICLPTPGAKYSHQVATISSWINGLSSDDQPLFSCNPRKIELPILDSGSCTGSVLESQGCVGIVGNPSVLCKSDAGAGVLYASNVGYYELVGILSDRQSCHVATSPEYKADDGDYSLPMFTKVNNYLNWILYHTKDGCYCNKL